MQMNREMPISQPVPSRSRRQTKPAKPAQPNKAKDKKVAIRETRKKNTMKSPKGEHAKKHHSIFQPNKANREVGKGKAF